MTISEEILDELPKRREDLLGDAGLMKELKVWHMEAKLRAATNALARPGQSRLCTSI